MVGSNTKLASGNSICRTGGVLNTTWCALCLCSLLPRYLGHCFGKKGKKIYNQQDLFNILGAIYILVQCVGINNSTSVLPFIGKERVVMYREKFAGMYSSWEYSLSQVTIEIPYIFFITVVFVTITYPAIGFYWSAYKVFWYFYSMFCTLLYFNYLGMMIMSWTSTHDVARIFASFCFTMLNLFSGFLIPRPLC